MLKDVGTVIEGKVTGLTNFGAFVQLQDGRTGLVHVSEVADQYVKDINQYLKVGQEVKVKIISIDNDGKIRLSIKQAQENRPNVSNYESKKSNQDNSSFEDRLSKFLKDSDERLLDLKRNFESKRGSGSKRTMQY
jgi:S1 RNA binding domain protein